MLLSKKLAKFSGCPVLVTFNSVVLLQVKKIVLNVPQELTKDEASNDNATVTATAGGFGTMEPVVEPVEVQAVDVEQDGRPDQFVTADELKENRLSQDGMLLHFLIPKCVYFRDHWLSWLQGLKVG